MQAIAFIFLPSFWAINIAIANKIENKTPQLPNLVKASFETCKHTQQIIDLDNEYKEYQDETEQLQTNRIKVQCTIDSFHFKCNQLEVRFSDIKSQLKQSRDMEVNYVNQYFDKRSTYIASEYIDNETQYGSFLQDVMNKYDMRQLKFHQYE